MNALTGDVRAEPGSAGAVKAVSVISTGTVRIHPEHPYGTRKPLYWWLLTSRQWTPPRPVNVYVIEHANGLVVFDTGQDRASVTDGTYWSTAPAGPAAAGRGPHLRRRDPPARADSRCRAPAPACRERPQRSSPWPSSGRAWSCCPPTTQQPPSGCSTADAGKIAMATFRNSLTIVRPVEETLGESMLWIRIWAANARNPLLLLVEQGPVLLMIKEVQAFRFTRMRGVL
jgi:hypothetical protein